MKTRILVSLLLVVLVSSCASRSNIGAHSSTASDGLSLEDVSVLMLEKPLPVKIDPQFFFAIDVHFPDETDASAFLANFAKGDYPLFSLAISMDMRGNAPDIDVSVFTNTMTVKGESGCKTTFRIVDFTETGNISFTKSSKASCTYTAVNGIGSNKKMMAAMQDSQERSKIHAVNKLLRTLNQNRAEIEKINREYQVWKASK